MKHFLCVLLFFFWSVSTGHAQVNLVPNGDFEDTTNCSFFGGFQLSAPWYSPNFATPDYFYGSNPTCGFSASPNASGHQLPRSGIAYIGEYLSAGHTREYIQCQLSSALQAGQQYYIGAFVNRANNFDRATDDFGIYLSNNPVGNSTSPNYLPVVPQISNPQGNLLSDSLNWIEVSGIYTAIGGELYISLGNFKDSANTTLVDVDNTANQSAYFYIDDVFVYDYDSTVSVNEIEIPINIGPNPATSFVVVHNLNYGDYSIEVINSLGSKLECSIINNRIDISTFSPGCYYVIVTARKYRSVLPFLKL
jgi:OmpA-OmpF porin, OOP family